MEPPTRTTIIAIAAAIGVVLAVGIVLAIAGPGDLDDGAPATTQIQRGEPDETTTVPTDTADTTTTPTSAETTATAVPTTTAAPTIMAPTTQETDPEEAAGPSPDDPLADKGGWALPTVGATAAVALTAVALRRYC